MTVIFIKNFQEIEAFKNSTKIKEEELEAKNAIIAQHESQISLLSEKLNKSESEYSALKSELISLAEKGKELCKEKDSIEESLKAKEEVCILIISVYYLFSKYIVYIFCIY